MKSGRGEPGIVQSFLVPEAVKPNTYSLSEMLDEILLGCFVFSTVSPND